MKLERSDQDLEPKIDKVVEKLSSLANQYFLARYLEISSLLAYLLKENKLKQENLVGSILDLGTGSGVGLVTLRKFSPGGILIGIDNKGWWDDPNPYTGFSYPIPLPGLLEAVGASFKRISIAECLDLSWLYGEKATLITAFYSTVEHWSDRWSSVSDIVEEIGEILAPKGQFLFTSDCYNLPKPTWANENLVLTGREGENSKMLVLPFPNWLRERHWESIQEEKEILRSEMHFFSIKFSLEDKIFETQGREIGLLRDRVVRLYTK